MQITNQVVKAILSQFAQKNNVLQNDSETTADMAALADLDDTTGEDDEAEPDLDIGDELDPSVEASDNAVVDDVAAEVNEDSIGLPPLSRADLNLGRFAITKVSANNYISQLVN